MGADWGKREEIQFEPNTTGAPRLIEECGSQQFDQLDFNNGKPKWVKKWRALAYYQENGNQPTVKQLGTPLHTGIHWVEAIADTQEQAETELMAKLKELGVI